MKILSCVLPSFCCFFVEIFKRKQIEIRVSKHRTNRDSAPHKQIEIRVPWSIRMDDGKKNKRELHPQFLSTDSKKASSEFFVVVVPLVPPLIFVVFVVFVVCVFLNFSFSEIFFLLVYPEKTKKETAKRTKL